MSYWRLYYHFVWATKNREAMIDERAEAVIRQSLLDSAQALKASIIAVGMFSDHAHLLVAMPPTVAPSNAASQFKGASSHAVRGVLPDLAFRWQAEYGVLSLSERGLPAVTNYAVNQRERHQTGQLLAPLERIDET
jgi:putative transposase